MPSKYIIRRYEFTCAYCLKKYEAKNISSLYCSDSCKMKEYRKRLNKVKLDLFKKNYKIKMLSK